jgi:hypothetical protein
MDPKPLTLFTLAWQMIQMHVFCNIIQIWIHYQAALQFIKGIVYIPPPAGLQFFAIHDSINPKRMMA